MESWRKVYRDGLAPLLSTKSLQSLAHALETDDSHLIQGATTIPPPLQCVQDWPIECGCLIAYCGVVDLGGFNAGELTPTVGEVEEYFARACFDVDQRLGEPAACRFLLNWFDDGERKEVFAALLEEVKRTLTNRHVGELSQGAVDVDVSPIKGVDL